MICWTVASGSSSMSRTTFVVAARPLSQIAISAPPLGQRDRETFGGIIKLFRSSERISRKLWPRSSRTESCLLGARLPSRSHGDRQPPRLPVGAVQLVHPPPVDFRPPRDLP